METNTVETNVVSSGAAGSGLESCQKAIRAGAVAAFIAAGITFAASLGVFSADSSADAARSFSFLNLIDVALLSVLGAFVYRKSRFAATLLVAYFVVDTSLLWIAAGEPMGLVVRGIFFLVYLNAMQATYRWHRMRRSVEHSPALA